MKKLFYAASLVCASQHMLHAQIKDLVNLAAALSELSKIAPAVLPDLLYTTNDTPLEGQTDIGFYLFNNTDSPIEISVKSEGRKRDQKGEQKLPVGPQSSKPILLNVTQATTVFVYPESATQPLEYTFETGKPIYVKWNGKSLEKATEKPVFKDRTLSLDGAVEQKDIRAVSAPEPVRPSETERQLPEVTYNFTGMPFTSKIGFYVFNKAASPLYMSLRCTGRIKDKEGKEVYEIPAGSAKPITLDISKGPAVLTFYSQKGGGQKTHEFTLPKDKLLYVAWDGTNLVPATERPIDPNAAVAGQAYITLDDRIIKAQDILKSAAGPQRQADFAVVTEDDIYAALGVRLPHIETGIVSLTPDQKYENACAILGVPSGASKADIQQKYKQLMKKWHPDRNITIAQNLVTAITQKITDAWDFINNPPPVAPQSALPTKEQIIAVLFALLPVNGKWFVYYTQQVRQAESAVNAKIQQKVSADQVQQRQLEQEIMQINQQLAQFILEKARMIAITWPTGISYPGQPVFESILQGLVGDAHRCQRGDLAACQRIKDF